MSEGKGRNICKLPVILQNEIIECGHACLVMIFVYHGVSVTLSQLRRLYPTSLQGISLAKLIKISQDFQFKTRVLQIDMDDLLSLQLPAILHWDMNHFVVLKKAHRHRITIHDPAYGEKKLTWKETSACFTGIALELEKEHAGLEPIIKSESLKLKRLFSSIPHLSKNVLKIVFLALLLQGLLLIGPKYFQFIIDHGLKTPDHSLVYWVTAGFLMIKGLEVLTNILRSLLVIDLNNRINLNMGSITIQHLLKLPLSFFEKRQLGDILSRFTSIENIRKIITDNFLENAIDGVMAIFTLILMGFYSPRLMSVILIAMTIYGSVRYLLISQYKINQDAVLKTQSAQLSFFMEMVRGILPVKIFSKEYNFYSRWKNKYIVFLNASTHLSKDNLIFENLKRFLLGITPILTIFLGAFAILHQQITLGILYAFLFYQNLFMDSSSRFIERLLDFRLLQLHLDRLSDILLAETEQRKVIPAIVPIKGEVRLEAITFRYAPMERDVIKQLSFSIHAGEFLAIAGSSGCGKTTLLKVIMGLLIPQQGEIIVDGKYLKEIGIGTYRTVIASVMQEDCLFSGSILQNISFFETEPDERKLFRVTEQAGILEDILAMPMKFHTLVGDMGSTLSGGQKQRVLLARALYSEPKLLFLDEASSHLDVQKESEINRAISKLNITRIIVAHRPETLRLADRVVQLREGVIV